MPLCSSSAHRKPSDSVAPSIISARRHQSQGTRKVVHSISWATKEDSDGWAHSEGKSDRDILGKHLLADPALELLRDHGGRLRSPTDVVAAHDSATIEDHQLGRRLYTVTLPQPLARIDRQRQLKVAVLLLNAPHIVGDRKGQHPDVLAVLILHRLRK